MNGKQLACVILMSIIGTVTYVAQIVHKKVLAVRDEARAAEDAAQMARTDRDLAETKSKASAFNSTEIRRFLDTWTPFIDNTQTSQEIEEAVQASIRSSRVYVDAQKFETKDMRQNRVLPRVVKAAIVAEDDYAKTLNWLGELEHKLPLARITACRVTAGKSAKSIRLELALEIPIINLKADPTESTTKKT